MRGCARVILLMVAVIAIISTLAHAQELAIPVDMEKSTCYGYTSVRFEGMKYRIFANDVFDISFVNVDDSHVRMFVIPRCGCIMPYHSVSVQWGDFPLFELPLGEGDSDSFLLGSETGYAEK